MIRLSSAAAITAGSSRPFHLLSRYVCKIKLMDWLAAPGRVRNGA